MKKVNYLILVLGLALSMLIMNVSAKNMMMNSSSNASASINANTIESAGLLDVITAPVASPDNQNIACIIGNSHARMRPANVGTFNICLGNPADTIGALLPATAPAGDTIVSYLWSTGATTDRKSVV